MTTTADPRVSASPARSASDVLLDQLRGIDAWVGDHPVADSRLDGAASREVRLDLARRRDVLDRQRHALLDRTALQLRHSDQLLHAAVAPRAVLVHRNAWFTGKVADGLAAHGVDVLACVENGADAVGIVVAEQPDLVLVEDKLPMLSGLDVVRAVRRYAPAALVAVQVEQDWQIGPFLDAGVTTAYTRRVPPADIAAELSAVLIPAA